MLAESDRFKAMLLLKSADEKRYGGLVSRLNEGAALGRNEYPQTVADMYELMCSQCLDQPPANSRSNNSNNRSGVNLLQHGSTPSTHRSSVHFLQFGVLLIQTNNIIDPNWVLLDTCSTDNVFNNNNFL